MMHKAVLLTMGFQQDILNFKEVIDKVILSLHIYINPLSPFFQIRNDKSVRGFKIEVKLTAFADDTTFFVKDEHPAKNIENNVIV